MQKVNSAFRKQHNWENQNTGWTFKIFLIMKRDYWILRPASCLASFLTGGAMQICWKIWLYDKEVRKQIYQASGIGYDFLMIFFYLTTDLIIKVCKMWEIVLFCYIFISLEAKMCNVSVLQKQISNNYFRG